MPLLCYQEFYYHPRGLDTDFDPELQPQPNWASCAKVRMKNAYLQLTLEASRWNLSPTVFQSSTFPSHWQSAHQHHSRWRRYARRRTQLQAAIHSLWRMAPCCAREIRWSPS